MVNIDLMHMGYYKVARGECCGRRCIISRTGYTGELGYEIMAPATELQAVFSELTSRDEVKPAGLGARNSLRLEMGYPLHGYELTSDHNPVEAGLAGFVEADRNFIGSMRIDTLREVPVGRRLIAFGAESRRRTNPGNEIFWDGQPVGHVTSGAFSPSLGISIGMGYVKALLAEPGRHLMVHTERCELPVTISNKPLYKDGTCRTRHPL
jgi:aminomethyltransferase